MRLGGDRRRGEVMERTIKIKGMSCQHCVMAVTEALESIEGIVSVRVNLEKGEATFEERRIVDMSEIAGKVRDAGYEVG